MYTNMPPLISTREVPQTHQEGMFFREQKMYGRQGQDIDPRT